jgi:hypothetical protein
MRVLTADFAGKWRMIYPCRKAIDLIITDLKNPDL